MLTRTTYTGRHEFNRRGKTKALKPEDQIVPVEVPRLIDQATFDAVQASLKARNPKVVPPVSLAGQLCSPVSVFALAAAAP